MAKFRLDFVTNSSSSSYICEICGEERVDWDMPEEFIYCENEHLICIDHIEGDYEVTKEDGFLESSKCPICTFQAYSQDEMAKYLLKTRKITREEVFAEIKKVNKRRKKLYDEEYIKYVFDQFGLDETRILKELSDTFGTYEKFRDELWKA